MSWGVFWVTAACVYVLSKPGLHDERPMLIAYNQMDKTIQEARREVPTQTIPERIGSGRR